jgi:hypothetical protein
MTLCPIAIAASCKKCPAFSFCPLKTVIGDYMKEEGTQTKQREDEEDK